MSERVKPPFRFEFGRDNKVTRMLINPSCPPEQAREILEYQLPRNTNLQRAYRRISIVGRYSSEHFQPYKIKEIIKNPNDKMRLLRDLEKKRKRNVIVIEEE